MHYYILDPGKLSLPEFERRHVELQGLIAEFNVGGEMARVTTLRPMKDLVDTAKQRGAKTLVACGNDDTFNLMLALLQGTDFTFAFIPFDEQSYLAKMLGVDSLRTAVKTIAARRIEKIDVANVNNHYFISFLEFGYTHEQIQGLRWWNTLSFSRSLSIHTIQARIDNAYNLTMPCIGGIIANTRTVLGGNETIANPNDGALDLLTIGKLKMTEIMGYKNELIEGRLEQIPHSTVIKCHTIELFEPRGLPISLAGRVITKLPATINILPGRLKIIVGRNRSF